jgi:hypothetical protein
MESAVAKNFDHSFTAIKLYRGAAGISNFESVCSFKYLVRSSSLSGFIGSKADIRSYNQLLFEILHPRHI